MTSHSGSAGSLPTQPTNHWKWLQKRLQKQQNVEFGKWLEQELVCLEERFSHLVTNRSREQSLRSDLLSDHSRK